MKKKIKIQSFVRTVCVPCGRKHDTKHKSFFGVWNGQCDICGATDVPVADAAHDFGIYASEAARRIDEIQDSL